MKQASRGIPIFNARARNVRRAQPFNEASPFEVHALVARPRSPFSSSARFVFRIIRNVSAPGEYNALISP